MMEFGLNELRKLRKETLINIIRDLYYIEKERERIKEEETQKRWKNDNIKI